jgi:hypothetical protein
VGSFKSIFGIRVMSAYGVISEIPMSNFAG